MSILEIADLQERVTFLEGKLDRMTRAIVKLTAATEIVVARLVVIADRLEVLEKEKEIESARSTGS